MFTFYIRLKRNSMDVKFWTNIYNIARYWILGVIALGIAIGLILYPKGFWEISYLVMRVPFGIVFSILYPAIFYGFFTFMVFYLWDPKNYTFRWSKVFSITLLYIILFNLLTLLKKIFIN